MGNSKLEQSLAHLSERWEKGEISYEEYSQSVKAQFMYDDGNDPLTLPEMIMLGILIASVVVACVWIGNTILL